MTLLYNSAQIQELEALVFSQEIDTPIGLMGKAGHAAFKALQSRWPDAGKIAVFCGSGNNAGDGFIVARLAHEAGLFVTIYTVGELSELSETARMACQQAIEAKIPCVQFHPDLCVSSDVDVIVDALLGTGLRGKASKIYAQCIAAINASDALRLSCDIPSGLNADTGCAEDAVVQADLTVSFIGLKRGLFIRNARAVCGEVVVDTLGLPESIFKKVEYTAELLEWNDIKPWLPRRRRDAHKGDFGHVLIIGGDYGMGGAVRMAAEAAMRVGAGLVTVATRPEHISVVSGMRPEAMCARCTNAEELEALLEHATTIVIGPGLGKGEWSRELLSVVLRSQLPKVLDADALNLLSQTPMARQDWVLTPHPGEASRLLQCGTGDVQCDRFEAAKELQHRYDGVIVLKGSGTIIQSNARIPYVCTAGNPGMATGGMGDILSGVIGGLIAQGLPLDQAAEAGVFIHSKAADMAAAENGERGLLATDILGYLNTLVNPYMQITE